MDITYLNVESYVIRQANFSAWYKQKVLHREDGPAIVFADGHKEWWVHGQCHREDGPAIERADGRKEWWLHDVRQLKHKA